MMNKLTKEEKLLAIIHRALCLAITKSHYIYNTAAGKRWPNAVEFDERQIEGSPDRCVYNVPFRKCFWRKDETVCSSVYKFGFNVGLSNVVKDNRWYVKCYKLVFAFNICPFIKPIITN